MKLYKSPYIHNILQQHLDLQLKSGKIFVKKIILKLKQVQFAVIQQMKILLKHIQVK